MNHFSLFSAHAIDKTLRKENNEEFVQKPTFRRESRISESNKLRSQISSSSNLYPPDDIITPNDDYFVSYDTDYVNPSNNFSAIVYDNAGENSAIFPDPEMIVYESSKTGKPPFIK